MNNIVIASNGDLIVNFVDLLGYLRISFSGDVVNKPSRSDKKEPPGRVIKTLDNISNFLIFESSDSKDLSIDLKISLSYSERRGSLFSRMVHFPEYKTRVGFLGNRYFLFGEDRSIYEKKVPHSIEKTAICAGKYNKELFWIGYQYGGVVLMDLKGTIKHHYLKDKSVTKIMTDHEGGMWITTANAGVFYSSRPMVHYYPSESYPIELTKDDQNQLFVAFHNGDILKKEVEIDTFLTFYQSQTNEPSLVQYNAVNDSLIYGDYLRLIKDSDDAHPSGIADDLHYNHMFSRQKIIVKNNTAEAEDVYTPHRISDISKNENDQSILIGTQAGLYEYKDQELRSLSDETPLFSYRIFDIDYSFETTFIATMGVGLVIKKEDSIFSIAKKNGLLSDISTEVFIEDKYTLWVGTNKGLNRITLYANNTYSIDALTLSQGLPFAEITDIEIVDNIVWIASKEGLFSFSKSIFQGIQEKRKKWIQIEQISANNSVLSESPSYTFKHTNNDLKFHFKSISFNNGKHQEYRYKIRNKDTLWNYTQNNVIDLFDIQPDTYNLTVQVKTEDNSWETAPKLTFRVLPPFWKTWWFYICISLLIVLIFYVSTKYKVLIFDGLLLKQFSWALINKLRNSNDDVIYVTFKTDGQEIRLPSNEIGYFRSSRNYIEVYTSSKRYITRQKLGEFYAKLPDKINYLQLHRSYYVRIEKVLQKKGTKEVIVFNTAIPVSKTYVENLRIIFK